MHAPVSTLEIVGLVKTYPNGHRALDGLSLRVSPGSITGFIGLNGAGKTTTIRSIAGLITPDAGTIAVFGSTIMPADGSYKRDIGFVLDEPMYFEWMDPMEYLRFVGSMYGVARNDTEQRSRELLEFFDLDLKKSEPIRTFSTGMKKKVSLAAAIIHKPRLLILDEPFEGIDALAANTIKETLTMMASRGVTILISSHVLDTIEKFCSHVTVVHHGRVLVEGPTKEIRKRVRGQLQRQEGASLEELFIELVSGRSRAKPLSFY